QAPRTGPGAAAPGQRPTASEARAAAKSRKAGSWEAAARRKLERRRAAPRREICPLWRQRAGANGERGGPLRAEGPPRGAKYAPSGGSEQALTASVGVHFSR